MPTETERRFLVIGDKWKAQASRTIAIAQAYLAMNDRIAMRVRIVDDREAALTIKSAEPGASRAEFEYPIPLDDARELMALRQGHIIRKKRHVIEIAGVKWEVDVFEGVHAGLVIAEIELPEGDEDIPFHPDWLGDEVTGDRRYYNADLAMA
jgi:adenylate cyclase